MMNYKNLAVGVDGCKFGWVSVCFATQEVLLFRTITQIINYYPNNTIYFFDIPIGLPDQQHQHRDCEKLARKFLPKNRKSSIFPVPCREALRAENYSLAHEINKKVLGVGVSKQTWFITHKINEMNVFLTEHPALRSNIKESHPELSFQFLNRNTSLQHQKKTEDGILERLKILRNYEESAFRLFNEAISKYKRADLKKDDVLDAMCLAITANQVSEDVRTVPENPIKDSLGIEMGIYYPIAKLKG